MPRHLRAVQPDPGRQRRAVLYVRVSALMGRGGDDFHSPGMQLTRMRHEIQFAGLREVGVVEDIDRSGTTFSREGVEKIKRMVEAGQVDVIAVYDLSRFGRNLLESLLVIKWLREHNVSLISSAERIDDTPEGQFMLNQFLSLAELQAKQIGRRWSELIARRAGDGRHHGVVPQGYERVDKQLVPHPALGPAVTEVFRAYAAGEQIADIMRRFSVARGKPVRRNVIKAMLANPVYVGRVVVLTAVAGRVEAKGLHDPLVDELTWERVQRRLARDRNTPPRRLAAKYSLTGLVWCGHCDGALQVWYSNEAGRVRRMVCSRARQVGDCHGVGTPLYQDLEDAILALVIDYAAKLSGNPAARAAAKARSARAGVDAAALERELVRTREAMGRITVRWSQDKMPDEAYDRAIAELEATQTMLSEQLDRVQELATAPDPGRVVRMVDDLVGLWPKMTDSERNRALRAVVERVPVRRAQRWREPVAERIDPAKVMWRFS